MPHDKRSASKFGDTKQFSVRDQIKIAPLKWLASRKTPPLLIRRQADFDDASFNIKA